MSVQGESVKRLSAAEYEQMCREVQSEYGTQVTAEVLLFALCKRVFHHIHGHGRDLNLPYAREPRQEVYKAALRRMAASAQSQPFDPLEIAGRYIAGI